MDKFYGEIGFVETVERDDTGIFDTKTVATKKYYGNFIRRLNKWSANSEHQNDDLEISSELSIIADKYAIENWVNIRYVVLGGAKWKVININPNYPRITLTLGGVYNGE